MIESEPLDAERSLLSQLYSIVSLALDVGSFVVLPFRSLDNVKAPSPVAEAMISLSPLLV